MMTLIPAYGRDYKSRKEVQADFDADKDFIIADIVSPYSGKVVNKSQLKDMGEHIVMIRFGSNRLIAPFKVQS